MEPSTSVHVRELGLEAVNPAICSRGLGDGQGFDESIRRPLLVLHPQPPFGELNQGRDLLKAQFESLEGQDHVLQAPAGLRELSPLCVKARLHLI